LWVDDTRQDRIAPGKEVGGGSWLIYHEPYGAAALLLCVCHHKLEHLADFRRNDAIRQKRDYLRLPFAKFAVLYFYHIGIVSYCPFCGQ